MQVITLSQEKLDEHAERLASQVKRNSPIPYDAIVGIRRGGSLVCDAFCRHFPASLYSMRCDVTLQRPSTKRKGRLTGAVLKKLPTPLLNFLRIAESRILSCYKKTRRASDAIRAELPSELDSLLHNCHTPKILVIDDALDSGDTLYSITETLKKSNPNADITTAVITETTARPRIRADYSLYRNQTLIRFPWANDYKNH